MQNDYDLIIVGAGLVGASLAVALQGLGLRIAIVEKHLPSMVTESDIPFRPISLAYGSVMILKTLNVWGQLKINAAKIEQVEVSEAGVLGGVHFNAADQGVDALGYVVPFALLHQALYQAAAAQAGVEVITIKGITRIEPSDVSTTVVIDHADGERVMTGSLLVGCDGARSTVRDLLCITTESSSDHKIAISARISFKQAITQAAALERFAKEGILAILPLTSKKERGLVWTLPKANSVEVCAWTESEWIRFLEKQFLGRLPSIESVQVCGNFPLETIIAKKQFVPGAILMGNAAHTLYPLAAQGFNLGLRDVAALAEVLTDAKQALELLGATEVLQRYVDWRSSDQSKIARLTKGISQGFSLQAPLVSRFRGLGMLMADIASPLKKRVARLTMGLSGRLPKLVRGLSLSLQESSHES